jgi:hypothetical protein
MLNSTGDPVWACKHLVAVLLQCCSDFCRLAECPDVFNVARAIMHWEPAVAGRQQHIVHNEHRDRRVHPMKVFRISAKPQCVLACKAFRCSNGEGMSRVGAALSAAAGSNNTANRRQ